LKIFKQEMVEMIFKFLGIAGNLFPQIFIWWNSGFWQTRNKMMKHPSQHTRKLYYVVCKSYMKRVGFFIGYSAAIQSEPIFPHGLNGIYISGGASIGKDCVIFPNVIIGSNTLSDSKSKGAPHIGDSCYIGAGATIIGNATIGNNCRIGANTTVTHDVPDNCIVINQPSRIIQKEALDNRWNPLQRDQ